MNTVNSTRLLFVAAAVGALSSACGDPRAIYVGAYNTSTTYTATSGGNNYNGSSSGTMNVTLSAQQPQGIVAQTPDCNYPATVNTDTTFTVDPVVCPPNNNLCSNFVQTVTTGNGVRNALTLTISVSGTFTANCFGAQVGGNFTASVNATKQ